MCVVSLFDAKANIESKKTATCIERGKNFFHLYVLTNLRFGQTVYPQCFFLLFFWETEGKDEEGGRISKTGNCGGKCHASSGGTGGEQKDPDSPNVMAKKKSD